MTDNHTALLSLDTSPHSSTFDERLSFCIDRVQARIFMLTPMWNKTPFHRLDDVQVRLLNFRFCRWLVFFRYAILVDLLIRVVRIATSAINVWVSSSYYRCSGARSDVIPGMVVIFVCPLVREVEIGVVVLNVSDNLCYLCTNLSINSNFGSSAGFEGLPECQMRISRTF